MKARSAWLVPFALALASVSAWVQADPAVAATPTLEVKTIDGADWSLAARRGVPRMLSLRLAKATYNMRASR